ncbi:MAG: LysR family transcriptional regulator [Lentisphaeria bacterium]|nr:LysR family transcriptional regulator [Lentisphaeria bacterium]
MTTVKQLKHFLVLSEELHFARAAEKLGISQATLSNEIKKMEKHLGFQLFDRSNKWEISMTAAGKSFYQQVGNVPEILDQARQHALEVARGRAGELSVAIASFLYDYFNMGCVCKKMRQQYPDVKQKIYDVLRSSQVAEYVRSGKADAGVMMVRDWKTQTIGLECRKVIPLQMHLAIPAANPLAGKSKITFDDLKNIHFIMPPREEMPFIRHYLDELFMTNCRCLPNVILEALGFQGIKQMVAAGHGIALLPHHSVSHLPSDIVMRKPPFELNRDLVVIRDENNHSQTVKNFMNLFNSVDPGNSFPD